MPISSLAQKYQAKVAIVGRPHEGWVYSVAREVDLNDLSEMFLVRDLSQIMSEFMKLYDWFGASSNNIFWNGTDGPLRVIRIPKPEGSEYITLINPVIKELSGKPIESCEVCSSLPGMKFQVLRRPYVRLAGNTLGNQSYVELEYGSEEATTLSYNQQPGQHEYEHLDGVTLLQHGTLIPDPYQRIFK